ACRERGIAVVVYDDNLNCEVLHDGGFLRSFPRLHVKSRDVTLSVYSRTDNRESRNEKRETTDEMRACAHVQADASEPGLSVGRSVGQSVELAGLVGDDEIAAVYGTPAWQTVTDAYHERIGIMGPTHAQQLAAWMVRGMAADVLVAAIDEAAATSERERNPRKRRFGYIDGILRNWYNDGIRTAADLQARARADPEPMDPVAAILADVDAWEQRYRGGVSGDT